MLRLSCILAALLIFGSNAHAIEFADVIDVAPAATLPLGASNKIPITQAGVLHSVLAGQLTISAAVASTTDLAASATAAYPEGIWRNTYGNGNGAPPMFYAPQTGTCASHSLASDNGYCVNTTTGDGNSWLARPGSGEGMDARQFGCTLDGTTDDTTCAQAAVAWLRLTGGPLWMTDKTTMAISAPLDLSASNWRWQCLAGYATQHNVGPSPLATGCVIKWIGGVPAGGYMITDIAPSGSNSNQSLQGQHFIGISLNGNSIAGGGLHVASVRDSEFGQIYLTGFNGGTGAGSKPGINFDVVHRTTTNFGEGCDNVRLNIHDILGDQAAFTSDVVQYNGWINTQITNSGCGNSYNTITRLAGLVTDSDIFAEYGGDNNRTVDLTGAVFGTGHILNVNVASNVDPADSVLKHNGTNSEIYDHISVGPIIVAGTGAGCAITPFVLGMCPTGLQFFNLDGSNGQTAPTLGTGVRPQIDAVWSFNNQITANPWTQTTFTQTTMSCSVGTLTAAAGTLRYKIIQKVMFLSAIVTITTVNTCAGFFYFPMPSGVTMANGLTQQLIGVDASTGAAIPNSGCVANETRCILQPTVLANSIYRVSGSVEVQ